MITLLLVFLLIVLATMFILTFIAIWIILDQISSIKVYARATRINQRTILTLTYTIADLRQKIYSLEHSQSHDLARIKGNGAP